MGGARNALVLAAAVTCLLPVLAPSGPAAHPVPAGAGPHFQSAGLAAMERWLLRGNLYADSESSELVFVRHQMMVVLAKLRAAQLQPDARTALQDGALGLWNRAQAAYDESDNFYHAVLPVPDRAVCISLDGESWALRATRALQVAGLGDAGLVSRRLSEGRATILNLLELNLQAERPACVAAMSHQSLALIALLDARPSPADPRLDRVVNNLIGNALSRFTRGAFAEEGFYQVETNAKLLWLLTDAAVAFQSPAYQTAAERLLGFLLNQTLRQDAGGLSVHNVRLAGQELVQEPEGNVLNQLWLAWGLNHYNQVRPGRVTLEQIDGVLDAALAQFWSRERGSFLTPGELVSLEPNALASLIAPGTIIQGVNTEVTEFAVALPNRPAYTYAAQDAAVLDSRWHLRFSLSSDASTSPEIVLTSHDLGGFNFTASGSPRLFRTPGGSARLSVEPLQWEPGPIQLLRFRTDLAAAPASLRLEGATPLRAVTSSFEDQIRVFLENPGTETFPLRTLRLEVLATELEIRGVRLNGLTIPVSQIEVVSPITTREVQEPHTRIVVSNVQLPPGQSEFLIEYADRVRPMIESAWITRDRDGRDAVEASPTAQALQGEPLYLRAVVKDNAALRTVLLRYQSQADPRETFETPMQEQEAGIFVAQVPRVNQTGIIRIQVVAIDAANNLNDSQPLFVDVMNPLLSGSRVLFAFSGTLFIAAFIIWAKVRRKVA